MKNISKILIGSFFLLAFVSIAPQAFASTAKFNDFTAGTDCPTLMVANYDDGTPKTNYCWPTTVTGDANETINVIVYYHNTGDAAAINTRVKISPQYTTSSSTHSFSGSVWADNAINNAYDSGNGTVNLSSSQILTFGSVKWYPDQSQTGTTLSNGADIFSSNGLNIGTIATSAGCPNTQTFCHQGWVIASFKISTTPTTSCSADISSNPSSVSYGGTSTLSWSTTGATSVSISGPLQSYPTATNGSVTTSALYNSATYTLTAYCSGGGTKQDTVVVSVGSQQNPTCSIDSFDADDDSISEGDSTTLDWNTTGGISISLSGDTDGSIDSNDFDGSIDTDELDNDETYTLTLYCANGQTDSDTIEVEIDEEDSCKVDDFYATPSSVISGGFTTLKWKTTDADDVSIFGGYYSKTNLSDDGSLTVGPIYVGTTYTIEASCDGDSDTDTTFVPVNIALPPPPIQIPIPQVLPLSVVTTNATNITQSQARLNGLVTQTGGSYVTAYFEYGTTASLGQRTTDQAIGTIGTNFWNTINVVGNTTYYFRAVATNTVGGVARGEIISFSTPQTIVNAPQVVYVNNTVGTGGGSPLISLKIEDRFNVFGNTISNNIYGGSSGNPFLLDNNQTPVSNASPGETVDYVVTYKNISGKTLYNTIITVVLPKDFTFLQSSVGGYSDRDRTLSLAVGTLVPNQEGQIYLQSRLNYTAKDNDTLVTTATAVFTTSLAENAPQDDAIAYALLRVVGSGFLAGLAFLGLDFLPNTLFGWLVLLFIIAMIIILARRLYRKPYSTRVIHTNTPGSTPMGHA